jgi:CheY-like chemotaxis protein
VVLGAKVASQTRDEVTLHCTVRDTGVGIPQEKQAAIFEAFTQVDNSTTRQHGGTGLGLAIAARLIELMGGRLWVESAVGQGSTFHFLARFGLPPQQPVRPSHTELAHLHGLPVLVVEDHTTQQRVLVELLQQWGMQPVAVASGQEAFRALEHAHQAGTPFALVLLDATLQERDGFSLTTHLTQHPDLAVAVIKMLTAVSQREEAGRDSQPGMVASLLKPIRHGDLLQTMLTALASQSQQDTHVVSEPPLAASTAPQHYRILLAEDNAVNQRILVRLLEKRGHTVAVAESGRKVLAMLEQDLFDLVLMDVQMPEIDGLTVTTTIRHREQQTNTHLPIIAMTAHAMDDDRKRCLDAGMDAYLSKPFHAADLFNAIAQLMSPGAIER